MVLNSFISKIKSPRTAVPRADDYEQVRSVAEYYSDYKMCFEGAGTNPGEKTLEDKFFEYEASCLTLVPFLIALFLRYRLSYLPNLVLHLEPRLLNGCPFR